MGSVSRLDAREHWAAVRGHDSVLVTTGDDLILASQAQSRRVRLRFEFGCGRQAGSGGTVALPGGPHRRALCTRWGDSRFGRELLCCSIKVCSHSSGTRLAVRQLNCAIAECSRAHMSGQ